MRVCACRLELWQDIARLKEQLKKNGVHEKIYHAKILQESEAVLALHQQLQPLRASLESFHGLPADLRLAKQHVSPAPCSAHLRARLCTCMRKRCTWWRSD
jgi:hypothetical protein